LLRREDILLGKIPTVATISSIIGGMQAQEAVKLIHGIYDSAGQCMTYVGLTNYFDVVRFQRNDNCLSHESYCDIIELDHGAEDLTGSELMDIAKVFSDSDDCMIELDREIVTKMECKECGFIDRSINMLGRLSVQKGICPKCGMMLELEMAHTIRQGEPLSKMTLKKIGVPDLHIMTLRNSERYMYFELTKDNTPAFAQQNISNSGNNGTD
ncbi:MAG TPA: hypothetical protein VIO11_00745, partial [Candidatus Methanoperedens sp.]